MTELKNSNRRAAADVTPCIHWFQKEIKNNNNISLWWKFNSFRLVINISLHCGSQSSFVWCNFFIWKFWHVPWSVSRWILAYNISSFENFESLTAQSVFLQINKILCRTFFIFLFQWSSHDPRDSSSEPLYPDL